jgi:hypothetical protein
MLKLSYNLSLINSCNDLVSDLRETEDGHVGVVEVSDHKISVLHYLHELVINSLVFNKAHYQLHQLLQ